MLRLTSLLFLGIFSLLTLLGNKSGRASFAQKGNTGAPGDETQGGQPKTCIACHNQGPILASLSISVLDSAGNAVSAYRPGRVYTARVTLTATGSNLQGYGFQMIGLRDSNNSDLDGFGDVNPNNYKIASIPGGRTYAEHDNVSSSNIFNVKWTAPPTGTGSITLYAAGNGVNSNGSTSGDGSGFNSLKLSELSSATSTPEHPLPVLRVFPNPVQSESMLDFQHFTPGNYQISAFDASGRMIWAQQQPISADAAPLSLPAGDWRPGLYFIVLEKEGWTTSVKVLKL